jgi:hypothetical protein
MVFAPTALTVASFLSAGVAAGLQVLFLASTDIGGARRGVSPGRGLWAWLAIQGSLGVAVAALGWPASWLAVNYWAWLGAAHVVLGIGWVAAARRPKTSLGWLEEFGWIQLGVLSLSVASLQVERYGLLTPQLGLHVALIWVLVTFELALPAPVEPRAPDGPSLWWSAVGLPVCLNAPAWAMVDHFDFMPSWLAAPPLFVFLVALGLLWAARRQWRDAAATTGSSVPPDSGLWRTVRHVEDVPHLLLFLCIARSTHTATRWQYLAPAIAAGFVLWRSLSRERGWATHEAENFRRYRACVAQRWVPRVL